MVAKKIKYVENNKTVKVALTLEFEPTASVTIIPDDPLPVDKKLWGKWGLRARAAYIRKLDDLGVTAKSIEMRIKDDTDAPSEF